ncbi:MAG: glycosyltransferase family 2 protein [Deltaproteobacteria bacterium]|nr:glycosyltransferase family 2 protein [Deltaproteobacteria bacterium]
MVGRKLNKTAAPKVTAVIVTWNKKEYVIRLLESLKDIEYPGDRLEILVVDNNSSDDTVSAIENLYPSVKLIKNRENLGGAGGFNTGMRYVLRERPESEYMWLLDNDVLVDKRALIEMVKVLEENSMAAVCGSEIIDIENRKEVIELGGMIDYNYGDVRRNLPCRKDLEVPGRVFEVDYLAACSLLARVKAVREAGVWHEHLFIYWDDMEWGARFNALGYKVLASNASKVYHPSWAGRTADNSAIWRNYYRSRNALYFFNNYLNGIRRRILLARIALRYMMFAANACLRAETALSSAFIDGIKDFLKGRYGKKDFHMPPNSLKDYIIARKKRALCLFVNEENRDRDIEKVLGSVSSVRAMAIIPEENKARWKKKINRDDLVVFRRFRKRAIVWKDKLNILLFLAKKPWDILVVNPVAPRMATIWFKDVARMDFSSGATITIEKMSLKNLFYIPFQTVFYLVNVLLFPPAKDKVNKKI